MNLFLKGFCGIDYGESATTTPDPFTLGTGATGLIVSLKIFIAYKLALESWCLPGDLFVIRDSLSEVDFKMK